MKTVLFITHYPNLYGANLSLLNLIIGLKKEYNIKPLVIIPSNGDLCNKLDELCIEYKVIFFYDWIHNISSNFSVRDGLYKLRNNFGIASRLKKFIKEKNIDIIYTNSSSTNFGLILSLRHKIPHIWHIREMLQKHYSQTYDFPPIICRLIFKLSNKLILVSNSLKELPEIRGLNNVEVIYNAICWKDKLDLKCKVKTNNKTTLGIVGLLYEGKNQIEAIEALHLLQIQKKRYDIFLEIIGDGNTLYIQKLKQKIMEYRLEKFVSLKGYVDNGSVFNNLDILIVCSKNEAFSRVIIEAMSVGIPVVGVASGGNIEAIKDNETGYLFNNLQELISKIIVLSENSELYSNFSYSSIKEVKEKYTIDIMADKVYSQISKYSNSKNQK
jgi:glycosyltransferase involved in cell wall biosynthesis